MTIQKISEFNDIMPLMRLIPSMDELILVDTNGEIAAKIEHESIKVFQSYTYSNTLFAKLQKEGFPCHKIGKSALYPATPEI